MARHFGTVLFLVVGVTLGTTVQAQTQPPPPERRWSADFGIGFDNSISGNINSSAIGVLNAQTAVILKNKYEDVYGTGLHIRFGGGYMLDNNAEVKVTFTFQSLDADLTPIGDLGVSNLYAQYDDYQSFGLDVGYRRYQSVNNWVRGYGEALIGVAFVDDINVVLAAPQSNFSGTATDFYDATAAFTFAINVGGLFPINDRADAFVQLGFRYVSGLSDVDAFEGTGLDEINESSSRWALPFGVGVRFKF